MITTLRIEVLARNTLILRVLQSEERGFLAAISRQWSGRLDEIEILSSYSHYQIKRQCNSE